MVDCAVVKMADQYEVGQVGGASVVPRSDVVGDAAGAGTVQPGYRSRTRRVPRGGALALVAYRCANPTAAVASGWGRWGSPRRR